MQDFQKNFTEKLNSSTALSSKDILDTIQPIQKLYTRPLNSIFK
jgi:hypothetical protein